jgi:tetratricopeptide (TPR) repeat protein
MQNSAESTGFVVGYGLFIIGPVVGVVLNIVAARRRGTNAKCAIAMGLTFAAWVIFSLVGLGMNAAHISPFVTFMVAATGLAAVITSSILAIIGLVEFRRRRRRYTSGFKRAIFALCINLLFFFGAAKGAYDRMQNGPSGSPLSKPTGAPGETVNVADWNFRLGSPRGWVPIAPSAMGPAVKAAIGRHRPEMYAMVVAENFANRTASATTAALELIKHNIGGNGQAEFLEEKDAQERSMPGRRLETRLRGPSGDLLYIHWVTLHNGTLYQVVTWGAFSSADQVRAESDKIIDGFEIIDPKRTTLPAADTAPATFLSTRFGYSVDLSGTTWSRRWPSIATDVPRADFGVAHVGSDACFCVVPVWLGNEEVDLDHLTATLAAQLTIPYPDDGVYGQKDWTQQSARGRAFAFERKVNDADFVYRLRVLRRGTCAYLLAAWAEKSTSPFTDHLDEAMDRVSFAEQVPVPPDLQNERERETHTLIYNDLGLACDRAGQFTQAGAWFKRGFDVTRRNATLLANYVESCLKTAQPGAAVAILDESLPKFPGNHKLAALRATAQYQAGDAEGALHSYAAIFDSGWKSDVDFAGYIQELSDRGRHDIALAALDRYSAGSENSALRRQRAQVLLAKGDADRALELLTQLRDASPSDQETAVALADAYLTLKRPGDALAECERMIAAGNESLGVLHRKSLAEFSLKRYRESKATLEKALNRAPGNPEIKRLLEVASGMLGEGSNSLVKTPIEPVKIPPALLRPATLDPSDEYLRGYSAWYRCATKAIAYTKGREFKITEHQVVHIRDQQGVEKFSTLEFPFDPTGEEIFVNDLTVKDAAGKVLARGKVEDSYVLDDGADQTASQAKILRIPVPGLQPGSTLECTVTRRESSAAATFSFQRCILLKTLPVLRSSLFVQAGRDDLRWETSPGLAAPQRGEGSLTWSIEKPAVYRWEPLQAPIETFVPMVCLGSAKATWAAEGREYLTQIKDRLTIDPAVRDAASEATKGLSTPAAKIAALARLVQRDLTYKAIEFGRRARIPNPSGQTLRNKYGDCKDHAVLLSHLLESAGIPSRLVLVRSSGDLQAGLPSLDQFDHMIAYVPGEGGGTFIDCTSKSSDLRTAPPVGLASRQALVLDPKEPRLQTIPPFPNESSTIATERTISFATESDLDVQEEVIFTGVAASGLRSTLLLVEPPQRVLYLQRTMASEAPAVNLKEAKIEQLEDPQAPLRLRLHYVLKNRFHTAGDRLAGQLPAIWERLYVPADPADPRFSPFKLWIPTRLSSQATLTPPKGWQAAPAKLAPTKSPFGEGSAEVVLEQGALRLKCALSQRAGQFPAAQYSDYLQAAQQNRALVEANIVLTRSSK